MKVWCALKRALGLVSRNLLRDLLGLLGLLGQKHGLDVRQHTTLGDGHTGEKLVQFLVVTDGQLQVTGDDPRLLVVTGGVSCQLENLGGEVFHDGGQVNWSAGTDALTIVALAEQTVDTANGELKSGTARAGLALSLRLASFTTSRHVCRVLARVNTTRRMAKNHPASYLYQVMVASVRTRISDIWWPLEVAYSCSHSPPNLHTGSYK